MRQEKSETGINQGNLTCKQFSIYKNKQNNALALHSRDYEVRVDDN